jgi:hypothetical protein
MIGGEFVEDQPARLCCGAIGGGWVQCVEKIVEHGSDDALVMKEIENKLRLIVRDIERAMAVCEKCNYSDEFLSQRSTLYKSVFRDVLKKHNNKDYNTNW